MLGHQNALYFENQPYTIQNIIRNPSRVQSSCMQKGALLIAFTNEPDKQNLRAFGADRNGAQVIAPRPSRSPARSSPIARALHALCQLPVAIMVQLVPKPKPRHPRPSARARRITLIRGTLCIELARARSPASSPKIYNYCSRDVCTACIDSAVHLKI